MKFTKLDMNTKYTPEEFAQYLNSSKPHIIKIEEEAQSVQFGTLEVKIEVRAGEIVKMQFWKGSNWLKNPNTSG